MIIDPIAIYETRIELKRLPSLWIRKARLQPPQLVAARVEIVSEPIVCFLIFVKGDGRQFDQDASDPIQAIRCPLQYLMLEALCVDL